MTTPTSQEIDTALKMLPARPDGSFLLDDGDDEEDRYNEEEMFTDILEYGHVRGPLGAGLEERPLVIHDTGFIRAISTIALDLIDVGVIVGLPLARCGGKWMDQLQATRGEDGLHELIVVNTKRPKNEACFPLPCLPSGMRRLALCFFTLRPLDADHLTALTELSLTTCEFYGQALSAVIPGLHGLWTLVMGCCQLTTGCSPDGLDILSTNLRCLHMWMCLAAGGVCLQYKPRLERLCTGVRPRHHNVRLLINLCTPGTLREIHRLMLHRHHLSFMSAIDEKLNGRRIAPLPNLGTMSVCLQMSTSKEILELLDLLRHILHLKNLTITRIDDTEEDGNSRLINKYLKLPV